jgi:hypothetical protein
MRAAGRHIGSGRSRFGPRIRPRTTIATLVVAVMAALFSLGGNCNKGEGGPKLSLTLNAVPDDMKSLLVVPSSGFVINVSFTQTSAPIDPASFELFEQRWGDTTPVQLDPIMTVDADGAVGVLSAAQALADGSHTLYALVADTQGRSGSTLLSFAVRSYAAAAPIGSDQFLFFDFDVDRDGDLAPDFPSDLRLFGLGSTAAPALSQVVETQVREAAVSRVGAVYWQSPTNGLSDDPVDVEIGDADPGAPGVWDTTRICVGGEDPTGGSTIGNVLIDPDNSNRTSVECSSLPTPTGIFPAELLVFASEAPFQETFDPLMPSRGGTPIGEDPLDATVLDPGFDYAGATPQEQARYDDIALAVQRFADALGSVMAHEAGHALGLVPPGVPGAGLFGGQTGAAFSHAVTASGGTPPENFLMKAGYTYTFAKLAGIDGQPAPFFRPLSYAYLRDRARTDATISELLPPPSLESVAPALVDVSALQLTITGSDFNGTPVVRLVNDSYTYQMVGEAFVDPETATGWVIRSQIPPGLYDLVYENSDGQSATLPDAVTVL